MENNINFDTSRYIQLLKKRKFLIEQGEFLNDEEFLEFLSYGVILENQIYYNRKDEYIRLVAKYLNTKKGKIAAQFFVADFDTIFQNDNEALDLLKEEILQEGLQRLDTFPINPKSEDFSIFIEDMVGLCESLTFDKENHDGITLDQFYDYLEKLFVEMQPYSDVGNFTLNFSKEISKFLKFINDVDVILNDGDVILYRKKQEYFEEELQLLELQLRKESEIGNSTLEFSKDFSKVLLVKQSYQIFFLVLAASGLLLMNLF
jgi:hypothetical protein